MASHIAIVGRDFCGSTLLSRLLWALPGVAAPGELHWLVDIFPGTTMRTRAGYEVSRACRVHGPDCKRLGEPFVSRLFRPDRLYAEIAKRLGCETLVSSDKGPNYYEALGFEGSAILLWKTPAQQAASDRRNEGRTIAESLEWWHDLHSKVLDESWRFDPVFVMSYGRLAADPWKQLALLADRLDLPSVIKTRRLSEIDYCHIGGSPGAQQSTDVKPDMRWAKELAAEEVARIEGDERCSRLAARLESLSL